MSDILRAALEPFARCADTFSDEMPDNLQVIIEEPGIRVVTLGDLRKARAALAGQLYNYQTTLPVKWSTLRDELMPLHIRHTCGPALTVAP